MRRGITRTALAIIVVALVAVGGVAAYLLSMSGTPPSSSTDIVLRIATRHDTTITDYAHQLFMASPIAQQYHIKDVLFVSVQPALWTDTIKGAATGGRPFDAAWGGGPTLFDDSYTNGLLAPLNKTETLQVVSQIQDNIGGASMKRLHNGQIYWVAAAISSFGFIINKDVMAAYKLPTPKLWEDLASLDFAKKLPTPSLAFATTASSTSHTRIYEIILEKFGWEMGWSILARMAANGKVYGGSVESLTGVQNGEVPVSIAIDYYGYGSELQFTNTKYVLPFNESIINGDPIALFKTSANPDAAQAFIQWVLSVDGQKVWMKNEISRLPVLPSVFNTPEGQARPDLYTDYNATLSNIGIPFDDVKVLTYETAMKVYFDAVFSDLHDNLVAAWTKITTDFSSGKITQAQFNDYAYQLGAPVNFTINGQTQAFTLSFAQSVNDALKTSATASQYAQAFRNAARDHFQSILSSLP
jgi:ABC-type Fe3+ transport system substrate-binding protein